jgi:ComF family protein
MPLKAMLNALAPPLCAGCGASAGAVEPLCATCRRELRWLPPDPVPIIAPPDELAPPLAGAARLAASAGDAARLARPAAAGARLAPPASTATAIAPLHAWAPVAYEGAARGIVRALKFKGATRAAGAMAAQIAANAPPGWLAPPAVLVPVPLHPARARRRGYNQAERLSQGLATRTGLQVHDCLERAGPRATQVGRDRAQRLAGISGTVRLALERAPPPPPRAVLVDDVITTGATLAACAAVLQQHGTREVVAVAYARTPGR